MKSVIYNSNLKKNSIYIKGILFGSIICITVIIVLLTISAFAITQLGNISTDVINIVIFAINAIGVFCGSFIALRIIKSKGIIFGAIVGGILFALIFIAGLISSTETLSVNTPIKLIISVIFGIAGGILGVNKKEKYKIN